MFEGLDNIKWEDFGDTHIAVGMKTHEIPGFIRDMLHDDHEEREWAIAYILGEGQHLGMLDKATPAIIPFVLEVLEKQPDYTQRGYLVFGLSLMFDHMFGYENFDYLRLSIATYEAITAGYNIYKRLLNDSEQWTRLHSAEIMCRMQDHTLDALSALTTRLTVEPDEEVRHAIVKGIIKLIYDASGIYLWSGDGLAVVQKVYAYLKDSGTFTEKVIFSWELDSRHFSHDKDIQAFIERIKARAKLTGQWHEHD